MFKHHPLIFSIAFTIVSSVLAASNQTCGLEFTILYDEAGRTVRCKNPGGKLYKCTKNTCTVHQKPLDQALYFTNCNGPQSDPKRYYVWPTNFVVKQGQKSLEVWYGKKNVQLKATGQTYIDHPLTCSWKRWDERNALRPLCNGCEPL
ncbi:hypothetical protein O181_025680 [Austropuccinia psidii MF-1]|uniref:Secreted protein n=1 Tax=Austropuccinia psidii MF-1 TaxID=1389203 RepID=A0A9Q3H1E8_9BASI|nr:hypothetical protein [Austropuccinia psidii MF-1]